VLGNQQKWSLNDDIRRRKRLLSWIANVNLGALHWGVVKPWTVERRRSGVSAGKKEG
jgi:hypothetical protein